MGEDGGSADVQKLWLNERLLSVPLLIPQANFLEGFLFTMAVDYC